MTTPYFSRWSRDKVHHAIANGEAVSLYVENLPTDWKPMDIHCVLSKYGEVIDVYVPGKRNIARKRFGFVRFRGIRDTQRLLADVNRVQGDDWVLRANIARERKVARPRPHLLSRHPPRATQEPRVGSGKSYATVTKQAPVAAVKQGSEATFVPTTETLSWLSRSAVGILKNPASMDSVSLLWVLHGMREVKVADMGGDRVLVSFPSSEYMDQLLHQKYDWISLWFSDFRPWQAGEMAVTHRCWIEVRGLPLTVWCQEAFQLISSVLGKLVRVHSATEHRKIIGAARIEIITEKGGNITKVMQMKVCDRTYTLEIVEGYWTEDTEDHSFSSKAADVPFLEKDDREGSPEAAGAREQITGRGLTQKETTEQEGDPFNLMPIISEHSLRGQTRAPVAQSEEGSVEQILSSPISDDLHARNQHAKTPTLSVVGSSSRLSPTQTPTYNPYTPWGGGEDVEDDLQGPPGFVTDPQTQYFGVRTHMHSPCSSSATPAHSASCSSADPNYIQFLEDRLDRAIGMARVSTRKKFKKSIPQGQTTSLEQSIV
ncbi:hypothetical protein Tsubulata_034434 [Turnera subulata]|uniref:RRM domain-containing protein n=1 Tax=Turnera subulata TaxID=218843 RepID=A0A9Q0G7X8_9ROSI|nr:hypothetical protein Tsubulata_034434 [Turnera subulata]